MPPQEDRNWPDHEVHEFLDQITAGGQDYRRLVERLPVIVYTSEMGEHGEWFYVSPQVEEILGYTAEEFKADKGLWSRLLHPEDREAALANETEIYLGDRSTRPVEYRLCTRKGGVVWMLDEAVLEADDEGVPVWHGVLYDITERKRTEAELQRALSQQAVVAKLGERALQDDPEALMRAATELIGAVEGVHSACIWELGRDGRRLNLRAGLESEVVGAGRRVSAARDSHAGAALDSGAPTIVEDWANESRFTMPPVLRVVGAASSLAVVIDGKEGPFGVLDVHSDEPHRFDDKDVPFVQAAANVLADAIERHAADQALRHRVLHDSLTGLPNRLSFIDALNDRLKRATSSGSPVGILFLDLDHFKLINDSLGHHAGDALLRAVAPRLRAHLRPGDIVARFGGDEFGVLIDHLADEEEAVAIADRVAAAFAQPFAIDGVDHFVTASLGIAITRPAGRRSASAELLIRDADAAMYRAKEGGRARCVLFDAEMRASALRRLEVERELRHALDRKELALHYQPVVNLRSGEISGLEALVRWQHPERGLLDPSEFVSIAEDSGLIEPIGRWVQEQACRQIIEWQGQRPGALPFDVAVNLSARQVAHRDLPATIAEVIARTGIDPVHLRLEITESVLVEESATAIASLEALNEIGVRLVLDDFGTGYSSLAYLNRFPFHALKIDRSFVDALGIEQERTAIVEAIIGMARALSLEVIAEGVESEVQLSELRRLGCDYAQGHLFHAAMPSYEISRLLDEGTLDYSGISPER
ncbi:MAG TPA: EAL domain-containing protein [Solirubrobacterales bacterium]|jgi:diguanylate cyclase (GGDEF)-like protein/PAS domain S-box-containing protein|nr:EAL domain-containing protein [Solirubrobacterales bacterium]